MLFGSLLIAGVVPQPAIRCLPPTIEAQVIFITFIKLIHLTQTQKLVLLIKQLRIVFSKRLPCISIP